jgi:hypothetical protein
MNSGNINLIRPATGKTNLSSKLAAKAAMTALALAGLGLATLAWAGSAPLPGNSHAFGKTLAQWQDTYFRWVLGQLAITPDANGNAVVGNVVLMPVPNTPDDGTPGHLDVTLNSGQGFTVPLLFQLGTSHTDGTPPDQFVDVSFFQTADLVLQIDGVTVVDDSNLMDYFSRFSFAPPIPINSPPIASVIWGEGLAIVHTPLSVGTHTLKLDLKTTQALPPNFGGRILEFHNTLTLTVKPAT